MEPVENLSYTHKYLIQFMLKHGIASSSRLLDCCKKISKGEVVTEAQLKSLLVEINRAISSQNLRISNTQCEVTAEGYFVLLNNKNDEISRQQLSFSDKELEYFRMLLKEIVQSEQRKLEYITCLNITSYLPDIVFSRDSGQKCMIKWINGGYFVKQGDFIHLGPRLILEFNSYLRSVRQDCVCHLCSEIAFTGSICGKCDKIYHNYCIEKYLVGQTTCPNCKKEWEPAELFQNVYTDSQLSLDLTDFNLELSQQSQKRLKSC